MIIGRGDIASVLNDRKDAIFFASGVSNSRCTDESEFERERDLLVQTFHEHYRIGVSLFYFSTISISFVTSKYTLHKLSMELMVRGIWPDYNIIRLGNISWGKNPNTFLNYIRAKQAKGEEVEIRDEWKYMLKPEQLTLITDNLPTSGKNKISIFGEMRKVKDLI